jgi:phospholipid/cholesterol/gamma-HCH transport system ATP-binding protein
MIEIRGLKKRLGRKQVLDGVDLDIEKGETLVVLGPSGTGKSVLLKHIIGLMDPDAGSIRIDGEEIVGLTDAEMNRVRRRFGMLFQSAALFDSMTVGENIALPMLEHDHSLGPAERVRRVRERLEWVGLKGVENMKPASLSGGMRKRVGLARALSLDPEYILYDEPTTGLDPIMADIINQLIRDLQRQLGVTSVVVTHDIKSAETVADRMVLLYQGTVVFSGTPDETRATRDPMVRQFLAGSGQGPIQPV